MSYKAKDQKILVLEDLALENPKTKTMIELLKTFNLQGVKTLFLVNNENKNVYLSTRNIPKAKVLRARDVNTYDVLNANQLVIFENSFPEFEVMIND